jgi:hypothetical protein
LVIFRNNLNGILGVFPWYLTNMVAGFLILNPRSALSELGPESK